jgi:site-specific recombinase XerD
MTLKDVRPMLATGATQLPEGDQWSYEVKRDGYRTLAVKDGLRVTLLSRNLQDVTAQYPTVARAVGELRDKAAILDGEIIAIDEHGQPSFQALHHQAALKEIDLRWHDLRHEGACRLLADGLDVRMIQMMLGHASLTQTQRYLNVTDEELRKGLEASWKMKKRRLGMVKKAS